MNCVIIDDEPLAAEVIKNFVEQIGYLQLVAVCNNPVEAVSVLNENAIDLVFLDIEMPHLTGIDLVKSVRAMPQFIFTTAYPQYALEGFNLDAVDYLVKPIPFQRFIKAVNKAKGHYDLTQNKEMVPTEQSAEEGANPYHFIFVKSEHQNIKVNIDEITHIQGFKDYIKIHTSTSNKAVLTLSNFKDILHKLPKPTFVRVHRSYIVNVSFLTALRKSSLTLRDTIKIPIGETYRAEVRKRLGVE